MSMPMPVRIKTPTPPCQIELVPYPKLANGAKIRCQMAGLGGGGVCEDSEEAAVHVT